MGCRPWIPRNSSHRPQYDDTGASRHVESNTVEVLWVSAGFVATDFPSGPRPLPTHAQPACFPRPTKNSEEPRNPVAPQPVQRGFYLSGPLTQRGTGRWGGALPALEPHGVGQYVRPPHRYEFDALAGARCVQPHPVARVDRDVVDPAGRTVVGVEEQVDR